jgi:hypothetical protein
VSRRHSDKEARRLIRSLERAGAVVEPRKHGFLIKLDGRPVANIPGTPSDARAMLNARADLRRAGLPDR